MKKLILLPILLLALTACGKGSSSENPSSSSQPSSSSSSEVSSSSSSSSSSEFVADTRVWSLVGSFGTSKWDNTGTSYDLTRVAEGQNRFEITLDLYVADEFAVIHDRLWDGQLGFSSINAMDPAACMIEGGGYDVKNAAVAVAGNYHVVLDTTNHYVPHIAVTRLGDPIVPPAPEADNGGWYLTGTINSWTITDVTSYPLTAVVGQEHTYSGTFDFALDAEFVVNAGGTYDLKRGPSKVQLDPAPIGIDVAGDNIKVTEAGSYKVTFIWATDLGGVIVIENHWNGSTFPEGYMSISAIIAEATVAKLYTTRSTVVGINGGSIFLEDADGSALNVYNSGESIIKDTLLIGNVVDAVGAFKIYNNGAELDAASLTLVANAKASPILPFVIADAAALSARMSTNYSLSGQLVRLNGVTVGPVGTPSKNNYVITLGTTTVTGYSFYSAAYETATPGTGRTAINAAITALNTGATTFNIVGVLYSSTAAGLWTLGITSVASVNV